MFGGHLLSTVMCEECKHVSIVLLSVYSDNGCTTFMVILYHQLFFSCINSNQLNKGASVDSIIFMNVSFCGLVPTWIFMDILFRGFALFFIKSYTKGLQKIRTLVNIDRIINKMCTCDDDYWLNIKVKDFHDNANQLCIVTLTIYLRCFQFNIVLKLI